MGQNPPSVPAHGTDSFVSGIVFGNKKGERVGM